MRPFFFLTTLALLAPLGACDGSVQVLSTIDGGSDALGGHPTVDASRNDASHGDDAATTRDAKPAHDVVTDSAADVTPDVVSAKGCLVDGGLPPIACSTTSECPCPTGCIVNAHLSAQEGDSISTCQSLCTTSADCADPTTACINGGCEQSLCASDGGGTAFGTCDVDGSAGTCVPSSDATGFAVLNCIAGGTVASGGTCSTSATRSQPGELCVAGTICMATGSGTTGTCAVPCGVGTASPSCSSGTACASTLSSVFDAPAFGGCLPTSGSGSTACVSGVSNELEACSSTAACGCVTGGSVECVTDPTVYDALTLTGFLGTSFGTQTFCERTCTTSADCPDPLTACGSSGHCTYNLCGNADAGTGFGGSCDAGGVTGVCYASWQDYQDLPDNPNGGFGLPYGVCIPGGTIADGAACTPSAQDRTKPSTMCIAGDVCAPTATGGICRATCLISEDEIDNSAECTGGGVCNEDAIGGVIGYCCATLSATGECE